MDRLTVTRLGMAALMAAVAACDGAAGARDGSMAADATAGQDAASPGVDAAAGELFIKADIDGVEARADTEVRGDLIPSIPGYVAIYARSPSVPFGSMTLYFPNRVGTVACSPGDPTWVALGAGTRRSDFPGGACSIAVSAAAPAVGDILEGTFSATLVTSTTPSQGTASITNGVFRVPRVTP
jgi:hypothetical protein